MDELFEYYSSYLKKYISEGRIDKVFSELLKIPHQVLQGDIKILKEQFDNVERQRHLNLISYEDYSIQNSNIVNSLLKILSNFNHDYDSIFGSTLFVSPYQRDIILGIYQTVNPNYEHALFHLQDFNITDKNELNFIEKNKIEIEINPLKYFYTTWLLNGIDYFKYPISEKDYFNNGFPWIKTTFEQSENEIPNIYYQIGESQITNAHDSRQKYIVECNSDKVKKHISFLTKGDEWSLIETYTKMFLLQFMPVKTINDNEVNHLKCFLTELLYSSIHGYNFFNLAGLPNLKKLKKVLPFDLFDIVYSLLTNFQVADVIENCFRYEVSGDLIDKFITISKGDLLLERKDYYSDLLKADHSFLDSLERINRNSLSLKNKFKLINTTDTDTLNLTIEKFNSDKIFKKFQCEYSEFLTNSIRNNLYNNKRIIYYNFESHYYKFRDKFKERFVPRREINWIVKNRYEFY